VSVLINLALAVKIAVFDSNYPFRPLCFGDPHLGIIALHQPMNERFRDRMQLALWNSRLSRDRILYISYWEWWNEKEILWNASRSIAVKLYEQEMGIKRMSDKTREKLQTARCKFIRKYALRKPQSQ
jgi:hypothetical protein